jgi:uncharacterized membrane protein
MTEKLSKIKEESQEYRLMKGSKSIKTALPPIITNLNYDDFENHKIDIVDYQQKENKPKHKHRSKSTKTKKIKVFKEDTTRNHNQVLNMSNVVLSLSNADLLPKIKGSE